MDGNALSDTPPKTSTIKSQVVSIIICSLLAESKYNLSNNKNMEAMPAFKLNCNKENTATTPLAAVSVMDSW